jgi:hypothetical protein
MEARSQKSEVGMGTAGSASARWLSRRGRARLQEAVVFALFFVWLWKAVGLHLIFHGAGAITNFPPFYTTWRFFLEYTTYPGGPTEYIAAFLSQLFYYPGLGSLVVTLQAWGLCVCVGYLLDSVGLGMLAAVRYVPSLLLLVIYGRYTYHFQTTLALLFALAFACGLVAAGRRWPGRPTRVCVFIVISLVCYGLAGSAMLVCALVYSLWQWMILRDRLAGLILAAAAAAIPYGVGVLGLGVSLPDAYTQLLPFSWRVLYYQPRSRYVEMVYLMVALVPAVLAAAGLVRAAVGDVRPPSEDPAKGQHRKARQANEPAGIKAAVSALTGAGWTGWTGRTLAAACILAAVAVASLDPREKARFAVDYYAYHRMWPEVLTAAQRAPDNHFVMLAVNRALYHTGRLGSEMFQWPQRPDDLLLTQSEYKRVFWQTFDVYLDLGLVNLAENALTEVLEGLGERPMILQRLATVNRVKGNLGTAKVYLGSLSHTLWHRDWALSQLKEIEADPTLAGDPEIQSLRSMALDKDRPTVRLPEEQMLSWLLEKNPKNQMAFEYLQSWLLLTKQLKRFVEPIGRLKDFGYQELPRHYEEATLIYAYGSRKRVDLEGFKPSSQLQQRAADFSGVLAQYNTDRAGALARMQGQYRGTYFYYFLCVQPERAK